MPPIDPRPRAEPGEAAGSAGTTMQQPAGSAALAVSDASTDQTRLADGRPEHMPSAGFSPPAVAATPPLQLPPLALAFPSDPTTELAPIQQPHEKPTGPSGQTLPPLSSVTGAQAHAPLPKPPEPAHPAPYTKTTNYWPSLNPFTAYYTPSYLDPVESSPGTVVEQNAARRGPSVSLDDPDVRMAAEALGQMRADFGSSPRHRSTSLASTHSDCKPSRDLSSVSPSPQTNGRSPPEPEPLLTLITTSHPLLATTIEGAASAYNSGKNYSPRLRTSAEYVESYLKPVGKAVGNVGRKTGVEGGVRWIFGRRSRKQQASADIETGERGSNKRLKSERDVEKKNPSDAPYADLDADADDRRTSISTVETLPAYDDQRSPAYTEVAEDSTGSRPELGSSPQPWGQRFVVTTSGLGVAMKQESLRSLRYCLQVLRDTHGYIDGVLVKLKSVIDEFDAAARTDGEDRAMVGGPDANPQTAAQRKTLIQRMSELRDDLFRVIYRTVQTISKYAGGALPENAKNIVQRQLMSLPGLYQFHYVRESEGRPEDPSPEMRARNSSHLALLFARESLQLMSQVADVLNRTLVSAEEWCETLYGNREQTGPPATLTEPPPAPARPTVSADQNSRMSG